jgi:hypothetical protein
MVTQSNSVMSVASMHTPTKVGDYAQLRPLTIVMKGESIPANSRWEGAPAVPVGPRAERWTSRRGRGRSRSVDTGGV